MEDRISCKDRAHAGEAVAGQALHHVDGKVAYAIGLAVFHAGHKASILRASSQRTSSSLRSRTAACSPVAASRGWRQPAADGTRGVRREVVQNFGLDAFLSSQLLAQLRGMGLEAARASSYDMRRSRSAPDPSFSLSHVSMMIQIPSYCPSRQ